MIINSENINTLIKNNDIVLVDFFATWCGPCKMLSPIIDALTTENSDIIIGKCDIDENSDIAMKYAIRSVPTLLFFKNGEVVKTLIGAQTKSTLQNELNNLM